MPEPTQSMIQVAAFYHFQIVEVVPKRARELERLGKSHGIRGLLILASEGLNGTVSGRDRAVVLRFLEEAAALLSMPAFAPKWSESASEPFRKFCVRKRQEIVTLGKPEVQPLPPSSPTHLSPQEWDRVMAEEDVVVLDTRNWYETRIGKFADAIDPGLNEFHEFDAYLEASPIPREKKVLIYCTGGIRCEKAIVEMHNHGFENVFQLDGGILNYLAEYPDKKFEGECFVFDNRVALDQSLNPTTNYKLCPHCGQPGQTPIVCVRCDAEQTICLACAEHEDRRTCSKNCAHHSRLTPGRKGARQIKTRSV